MRLGTSKALNTLGRSITLKKAGYTDIEDIQSNPDLAKFRQRMPKSKIPGEPVYVEKTKFLLSTSGAKSEIQAARHMKKMMGLK